MILFDASFYRNNDHITESCPVNSLYVYTRITVCSSQGHIHTLLMTEVMIWKPIYDKFHCFTSNIYFEFYIFCIIAKQRLYYDSLFIVSNTTMVHLNPCFPTLLVIIIVIIWCSGGCADLYILRCPAFGPALNRAAVELFNARVCVRHSSPVHTWESKPFPM